MEIFLGILLTTFFLWMIICSQFLEELSWKTVMTVFLSCLILSMVGRFFGILRISVKVTTKTVLKENVSFNENEPIEPPVNSTEEIASAEALPFVTISTATPLPGLSSVTFSPTPPLGEPPASVSGTSSGGTTLNGSYSIDRGTPSQ